MSAVKWISSTDIPGLWDVELEDGTILTDMTTGQVNQLYALGAVGGDSQ